jgi:hypothetical protein
MTPSTSAPERPSWSTSSRTVSGWTPILTQGPYWASFEQFRTAGSTSLESIRPGMVATLNSKSATFRILRDDDFQKLLGLAAEVHRIRNGITFVAKAAKIVAKHKDRESIELLIQSVAMLGESRVLPEREGHDRFEMTAEEIAENAEDDFDASVADIPRPL